MSETSEISHYPKVFVFDLDYTLWPCWCDTHITPPVRETKDGSAILDRYDERISFYHDVPEIISGLQEKGVTICVATRTHAPKIAQAMLRGLKINGKPAHSYFKTIEFGIGSKVSHFKQIKEKTGVEYKDMLFFDDEHRNIDVQHKLGVQFVEIPTTSGVTKSIVEKAVEEWRRRHHSHYKQSTLV